MAKTTPPSQPAEVIDIGVADLPLHCPRTQRAGYDTHPRVFLPIDRTTEALCPYCGTRYRMRSAPLGELP